MLWFILRVLSLFLPNNGLWSYGVCFLSKITTFFIILVSNLLNNPFCVFEGDFCLNMDRNIKFPLKLWEAVTIHLLFSQDHQSAKSVWFYKIGNQGFGTKWDQNDAKGDRNKKFPLELDNPVTMHLLFSEDHTLAKSVWFYKIGKSVSGTKGDQNGSKGDRKPKFPLELDNPVTMHLLFSEDHNLAKSVWFYKILFFFWQKKTVAGYQCALAL